MRLRLTVEYDPDWTPELDVARALEEERQAWLNGDVSVIDVLDVQGVGPTNLKVEVIDEA